MKEELIKDNLEGEKKINILLSNRLQQNSIRIINDEPEEADGVLITQNGMSSGYLRPLT